MMTSVSTPSRAAKTAHSVSLHGATATAPPRGVPTLAIWGMGSPTRQIVGATNVYLSDHTHVQVVTSSEAFAAEFEFFTGAPPATTEVLAEPAVQLEGRVVIFPQNIGAADTTLDVFEVDGDTGARVSDVLATYAITGGSAGGAFGPFDAIGGRHYEFVLSRTDTPLKQHFYSQPYIRSDHIIRLLTVEPDSPFATQTDT